MRKYSFILLFLTLVAGAVGFYSRSYELRTVFEPLTGLAMRGAAASAWLSLLTVLFLIIVVAFSFIMSLRYKSPPGYVDAFGSGSVFYPLAFVIIALIWICGTVIYVADLVQVDMLHTADIYFAALSALSALSVAFFSIEMYQSPGRKAANVLSLIPIVFLCYWLILLYRENASNPVLISYVYRCFAVATSALSFYFTAGFLYRKPAPELAIISYSSSIYFCNIAQADGLGTGISLILSSVFAINAVNLFMLIYHMVRREDTVEKKVRKLKLFKRKVEENDDAER